MAEPAPAPMPEPMAAPAPEEAAAPAPSAPVVVVSGYVDAAYHLNWTDTGAKGFGAGGQPLNPYNPNGQGFTLHSAHLNVDAKLTDTILAHIGIDAGSDATVNGSAPFGGGLFDILEAYAAYADNGWTLTVGKFTTYEGIEVVQSSVNPTVSYGYLYYYAEPITHTGFKAHYQASDTVNIGLGVVNGWDKIIDNNGMKTIIGRIGLTPSSTFWAGLSGTFGSENPDNKNHRLSLDLTGAATLSDSFVLNFQANFGMEKPEVPGAKTAKWFGLGVQPVYTDGDFSFGSRLEYFGDFDGARVAGTKANYINVTLAPGYKLAPPFKIRFELRADIATEKVLVEKDHTPKKFGLTSAVAAEYVF